MAAYAPKEAENILDIRPSTLRKYAISLEMNGYSFQKNILNHREYKEEDLEVFRRLIVHKEINNMTVEDAAKKVIAWKKNIDVAAAETGTPQIDEKQGMLFVQMEVYKKTEELFKRLSSQLDNHTHLIVQQTKQLKLQNKQIKDQSAEIEKLLKLVKLFSEKLDAQSVLINELMELTEKSRELKGTFIIQ